MRLSLMNIAIASRGFISLQIFTLTKWLGQRTMFKSGNDKLMVLTSGVVQRADVIAVAVAVAVAVAIPLWFDPSLPLL